MQSAESLCFTLISVKTGVKTNELQTLPHVQITDEMWVKTYIAGLWTGLMFAKVAVMWESFDK